MRRRLRVQRADAAGILLALLLAAVLLVAMAGHDADRGILIIPASAARLLTDRFARLLGLATALGAAIGVLGMFASYYLDMASGATIVLVGTGVFAVAWLLSTGTGKACGPPITAGRMITVGQRPRPTTPTWGGGATAGHPRPRRLTAACEPAEHPRKAEPEHDEAHKGDQAKGPDQIGRHLNRIGVGGEHGIDGGGVNGIPRNDPQPRPRPGADPSVGRCRRRNRPRARAVPTTDRPMKPR